MIFFCLLFSYLFILQLYRLISALIYEWHSLVDTHSFIEYSDFNIIAVDLFFDQKLLEKDENTFIILCIASLRLSS